MGPLGQRYPTLGWCHCMDYHVPDSHFTPLLCTVSFLLVQFAMKLQLNCFFHLQPDTTIQVTDCSRTNMGRNDNYFCLSSLHAWWEPKIENSPLLQIYLLISTYLLLVLTCIPLPALLLEIKTALKINTFSQLYKY